MSKLKGIEFFEKSWEIYNDENPIGIKYSQLRTQLDMAAKFLTSESIVPLTRLVDRILYLKQHLHMPNPLFYKISSLRIHANEAIHSGIEYSQEVFLSDFDGLCQFLSFCFQLEIPAPIQVVLADVKPYQPKENKADVLSCLRVTVAQVEANFLYAYREDQASAEPIKIAIRTKFNDAFDTSLRYFWVGAAVNLIDVVIDKNQVYSPRMLILEPDYLLDISAIAEQYKDYGVHPYAYFKNKFEQPQTTLPKLLGNMANLFLDEIVNEQPAQPVIFKEAAFKAFQEMPLEYASVTDFKSFFNEAELQFQTIVATVQQTFPLLNIDREKAVLEPSFICEELGLQGRLDFLQLDAANKSNVVIELKSGKAAYPDTMPHLIKINHETQTSLYQYVIQRMYGISHSDLSTYVFYSKYADSSLNLRPAKSNMGQIKAALNLRNILVAIERTIAIEKDFAQAKKIFKGLDPDLMYQLQANQLRYFDQYVRPEFTAFSTVWNSASALEQSYFLHLWQFSAREHWLSKLQLNSLDEVQEGSVWKDFSGKMKNGDILYDLTLQAQENYCDRFNNPTVRLTLPIYETDFLPNFRQGDLVVLYQRNSTSDYSTTQQVFKASIQHISAHEVQLRLNYRQRNKSVLPLDSTYAIEHDSIDSAHATIYRSLFKFLNSEKDRRNLLLNQRAPRYDASLQLKGSYSTTNPQINQLILKAKQAQDYFLLVGPPGTGKTSLALKSMVEEFLTQPNSSLLLLSYTNRAVDEICEALDHVAGTPDYIRIGSENACEEKFRPRLLKNVAAGLKNRSQVREMIQNCRIYVGTVASMSSKQDIYKLKQFDVAIIDEASQILEGNLLGILSEQHTKADGTVEPAIKKFILIGDHKQLPAVVVQAVEESRVGAPELVQMGMRDRRDSLFERLYNLHRETADSPFCGYLDRHGRMHPEIALFPNYLFYNGRLKEVGTPHQKQELEFRVWDQSNPIKQLIAQRRMGFIPSAVAKTRKTNREEAQIIQQLVLAVYQLYQLNNIPFKADESIGIITPYRSQIALIKREILALEIPELTAISVDTVERYQGSQRDIILYSFAINQFEQLDFLANVLEEDGHLIDRKLNVALTRAKKQLFITGCPSVLSNNLTYYRLLEFIRSKSGYVQATAAQFVQGEFVLPEVTTALPQTTRYELQACEAFQHAWEHLVNQPLQADSRSKAQLILGHSHDYNRLRLVEFGHANFDLPDGGISPEDRANLYSYYQMPKWYAANQSVFTHYQVYFSSLLAQTGNRLVVIDYGCGPMTAALAISDVFGQQYPHFRMDYIGVEPSQALRAKAMEFAQAKILPPLSSYQIDESLAIIAPQYWDSLFSQPQTVVWNFANSFATLSLEKAEELAEFITQFIKQYPLNQHVLVLQNDALEGENRNYIAFKRMFSSLQLVAAPQYLTAVCQTEQLQDFDAIQHLYVEVARI